MIAGRKWQRGFFFGKASIRRTRRCGMTREDASSAGHARDVVHREQGRAGVWNASAVCGRSWGRKLHQLYQILARAAVWEKEGGGLKKKLRRGPKSVERETK